MESVIMPEVNLVDSTGRSIGVYMDRPSWWANLENNASDEKKSIDDGGFSAYGSQAQLIKANTEKSTQTGNFDENSFKEVALEESGDEEKEKFVVIGETLLHIAIILDDFVSIKYLIEKKGFDVNQRSISGEFEGGFNSKASMDLIEEAEYDGMAYYGEYPLAFAACFASKDIYDYLIEKGADPNLQDTYGNTVLHVLVIQDKVEMFLYAVNHPVKKALFSVKNAQKLTPLNLAAKLGRKDLFEKMLDRQNVEFWSYSNVSCVAYPLDGLDTVNFNNGKIERKAALSFIIDGETEEHLDMLEILVVKRLLENKWALYVQRQFFKRLIISTLQLIFLSIAVYTRSSHDKNLRAWPPRDAANYVRYISEIIVVLSCILVEIKQIPEIKAQGFLAYLKNLSEEPANVFYQLFCILTLCAIPFRFVTFDQGGVIPRGVEDTFVILMIPCAWLHLLFYARVANLTGPFVIMIYKMIVGDILQFSSVFVIILIGLAFGIYYLYKNIGDGITGMSNIPESIYLTFIMSLGDFRVDFEANSYAVLLKAILIFIIVFMNIILVNMLIAMMGNTYNSIIEKAEKEWRRQWAHIVILLERSFGPKHLKKFQEEYTFKLKSDDPKTEKDIPMFVLIKKDGISKAAQKKISITNWKKFISSIMKMVKKEGRSAVDILKSWDMKWEEVKIAKPKKVKTKFDWSKYEKKSKSMSKSSIEVKEKVVENEQTNNKSKNKEEIFNTKKPTNSELNAKRIGSKKLSQTNKVYSTLSKSFTSVKSFSTPDNELSMILRPLSTTSTLDYMKKNNEISRLTNEKLPPSADLFSKNCDDEENLSIRSTSSSLRNTPDYNGRQHEHKYLF